MPTWCEEGRLTLLDDWCHRVQRRAAPPERAVTPPATGQHQYQCGSTGCKRARRQRRGAAQAA